MQSVGHGSTLRPPFLLADSGDEGPVVGGNIQGTVLAVLLLTRLHYPSPPGHLGVRSPQVPVTGRRRFPHIHIPLLFLGVLLARAGYYPVVSCKNHKVGICGEFERKWWGIK